MIRPGLIHKGTNLSYWSGVLDNYLRSITPRSSGNVAVSCGSSGSTFLGSQNTKDSSPPVIPRSPFSVIKQITPGTGTGGVPASYQWGVYYYSGLWLSLKPDDDYSITNLLSSDPPTSTDPGWNDILPTTPDAIWLECEYDNTGMILSAQIKTWGNSDEFDVTSAAWNPNAYVEGDASTPTLFKLSRTLLAYSKIVGGVPVITQLIRTNLVTIAYAINGRPAMIPVPYQGGYPTS